MFGAATRSRGRHAARSWPQAREPFAIVLGCVRDNIRASANHLRHGSDILEQLTQNDGLLVAGAEYSLDPGIVEFFDGTPAD